MPEIFTNHAQYMHPESMSNANVLRTRDVVPPTAKCRFNNCLCSLFSLVEKEFRMGGECDKHLPCLMSDERSRNDVCGQG